MKDRWLYTESKSTTDLVRLSRNTPTLTQRLQRFRHKYCNTSFTLEDRTYPEKRVVVQPRVTAVSDKEYAIGDRLGALLRMYGVPAWYFEDWENTNELCDSMQDQTVVVAPFYEDFTSEDSLRILDYGPTQDFKVNPVDMPQRHPSVFTSGFKSHKAWPWIYRNRF